MTKVNCQGKAAYLLEAISDSLQNSMVIVTQLPSVLVPELIVCMTRCPRQVITIEFGNVLVPGRELLASCAKVVTQPLRILLDLIISEELLGSDQRLRIVEHA